MLGASFITVIPTPAQALTVLGPLGPSVWTSVQAGVDGANDLQPSAEGRDNYFWSHCARYYNRRRLFAESQGHRDEWQLIPDVPNTGIHLIVDSVHRVRVLRSLNGDVPHPGRNRARRKAWSQPPGQGQLFITADNRLVYGDDKALLALSLLIDWHLDRHGEPVIHVSLPVGPWEFTDEVRVHWRVPLPGAEDFSNMAFNPPKPSPHEFGNLLRIDPNELGKQS